jgi:hypothetical protein
MAEVVVWISRMHPDTINTQPVKLSHGILKKNEANHVTSVSLFW